MQCYDKKHEIIYKQHEMLVCPHALNTP